MSANQESLIEPEKELLRSLFSKSLSEKDAVWKSVYKNYYPPIREFVLKNSGSASDAQDVFHDGLIVLHGNLLNGTFRQEASVKTYIFRVCRNLWLKELQKKKKLNDSAVDIVISAASKDRDYLIDVEIITLLMNELKDDCRRILVEYYLNNRSMAELKDMFNVSSIQAAKNKKLRCMGYLVRLCNERGINPTTS